MDRHEELRAAAIARITDKRDFRNHAVAYCLVNALLLAIWAATGAGYFWPIWPIIGWGMALALHAWRTFGQTVVSEADIVEEMDRLEAESSRTKR